MGFCIGATAKAPAIRQIPIASVVSSNSKNKKLIDLLSKRPKKTTTENQRFTWSLVRILEKKDECNSTKSY
jgi:hypothetical protein